MKKLLGLGAFLLLLYVMMLLADDSARSLYNHINLGKRIGLFGVISLGAGILIISGGIDLSIGSVVIFCSTILAILLTHPKFQWHPALAIAAVLAVGALVGLVNGLIVTKLRVQAFVVTLCGLFIYRGAARWLASDSVQGLGTSFSNWKYWLAKSHAIFGLPMALVIFLALAAVAAVFLHASIYGRYLFAIGNNEQAARYAGVPTDRYRIAAYVICSTLTAFFSVMFLMEENSVQPSTTGNFFELYAIAGAVLGGCSLRGGEGSVLGILIGTAIIRILPTFTQMWKVDASLEYTVIGGALLLGALLDELLRRRGR